MTVRPLGEGEAVHGATGSLTRSPQGQQGVWLWPGGPSGHSPSAHVEDLDSEERELLHITP